MKRIYYSILMVLLLAAGQYACKKEEGAPFISKVALVDSLKRDSGITAVLPGTLLRITGGGFTDVQQVFFNDVAAPINPALNTSTSLIIPVPASTPTGADGTIVPNILKVVTPNGVAEYKFQILAPPPAVIATSNDNAAAGKTIVITGTNFYKLSAVSFGATAATSYTYTVTAITAVVPVLSGAVPLIVRGEYGADTTSWMFNNAAQPGVGFMANFDVGSSYRGWQQWGGISTDGSATWYNQFPGHTGDFIVVNPSSAITPGNNAWWGDNRAVMVAGSPWVAAANAAAPAANYALRFEISVPPSTPWTQGAIMIVPNGNFNYMARYAPSETAPNGTFSTNGWQTVVIPLSAFRKGTGSYNASGEPPISISDLAGAGANGSLQLMLYNDGEEDITTFRAAFDNVRIVNMN